ncbi:hypothetical protein NKH77_32590 [Streptomyces sp. M19]
MTRFLTGPPGLLIVTGTAASGKSAVLGRAVTLSDPPSVPRSTTARRWRTARRTPCPPRTR